MHYRTTLQHGAEAGEIAPPDTELPWRVQTVAALGGDLVVVWAVHKRRTLADREHAHQMAQRWQSLKEALGRADQGAASILSLMESLEPEQVRGHLEALKRSTEEALRIDSEWRPVPGRL
jgi:hypothetical protein